MPHPKVKIADNDGNTVGVTNNKLDVNAVLSASDNIEIGNVDIQLNGTAVSPGADPMDNGTIRIALATDDTQFGEIGSAADADGNIHGQLLFIANSLSNQTAIASHLNTTQTVLSFAASTTGGQYAEGDGGFLATGVRNDTLASLVSVDHDHAPFQVNASGALYVEVASSLPAGTNAIGKVGHDITGGGDGTKLVLSAGSDLVLGPSVACKKVDIQAQTDNTGLIAVGFTGVDATVADGTGIILNPGDTYSLEISNLNLIYIDATVSGEGVRYTYFT